MNNSRQRPSIIGPLFLIIAGIVLLLNQAGRLPWGIWGTLWRFWPLMLILVGIEVLIGISRSTVVYVAGLIIAAALIVGAVLLAVYLGQRPLGEGTPASSEAFVEALHDADRAKIQLKFAIGNLRIGALQDSPNLVEGEIEYSRYSRRASRGFRDRAGVLEFSLKGQSGPLPVWIPGSSAGENWDLRFATRLPLELEVHAGAADLQLDLSQLEVTLLDVEGGAGRTHVTFPAQAGFTQATVSTGVGQITVEIPDSVGARVRIDKALSSIRVENPRLLRSGDGYVSADYDTAQHRLDLEIESALGAVVIR